MKIIKQYAKNGDSVSDFGEGNSGKLQCVLKPYPRKTKTISDFGSEEKKPKK